MIKEYLLRTRQELMEQKIDAAAQGKKIEMEMEEINEFISVIESAQDKSYEAFFPQNMSAISDSEKIKELKADRKKLEENAAKIQMQIETLSEKIAELDDLVHMQKQTELECESMKQQLEKDLRLKENLIQSSLDERSGFQYYIQSVIMESVNELNRKMGFCMKLADMDPKRCWLELQISSKTMQKMICDLKDVTYQIYPFLKKNLDFSIRYYIEDFQKKNDISIDYRTEMEESQLPDRICFALIRSIQEVCDHVKKCEEKSMIDLELIKRSQNIVIRMKLSGCGFYHEHEAENNFISSNHEIKCLSLKNLLDLFSGTIQIKKKKDGTTRIEIVIPCDITRES